MEIYGYKTRIVYNGQDNRFTMICSGIKGGPIICAKSREECIRKFKEALGLAIVVKQLMVFKELRTFNYN